MALYGTLEKSEEGLLGGLKLLPQIRTFDVCDSFLAGSNDATVSRKCCEIAWNDALYIEKILRKVIGKRAFKPYKTERLTPSQQLRRVTKYPIKVHVWAAISVSGVIGP